MQPWKRPYFVTNLPHGRSPSPDPSPIGPFSAFPPSATGPSAPRLSRRHTRTPSRPADHRTGGWLQRANRRHHAGCGRSEHFPWFGGELCLYGVLWVCDSADVHCWLGIAWGCEIKVEVCSTLEPNHSRIGTRKDEREVNLIQYASSCDGCSIPMSALSCDTHRSRRVVLR